MTVSKLYIEARRHALEERCARPRTRTRSGRAKKRLGPYGQELLYQSTDPIGT